MSNVAPGRGTTLAGPFSFGARTAAYACESGEPGPACGRGWDLTATPFRPSVPHPLTPHKRVGFDLRADFPDVPVEVDDLSGPRAEREGWKANGPACALLTRRP
jgi:hypothetical protein